MDRPHIDVVHNSTFKKEREVVLTSETSNIENWKTVHQLDLPRTAADPGWTVIITSNLQIRAITLNNLSSIS
jgi:hypothetical protein